MKPLYGKPAGTQAQQDVYQMERREFISKLLGGTAVGIGLALENRVDARNNGEPPRGPGNNNGNGNPNPGEGPRRPHQPPLPPWLQGRDVRYDRRNGAFYVSNDDGAEQMFQTSKMSRSTYNEFVAAYQQTQQRNANKSLVYRLARYLSR